MTWSSPTASGTRGAVAAKHALAAQAGLEMLELGGNAVDATVATAFTSGVVEPWMSGIGGGGYMIVLLPDGSPPQVVDCGFRAPRAAHEHLYEVVEGRSSGLFPWPLVRDDANHHGWCSVAVPGQVAGLALALERFGRLDLRTVLQPAIRHASQGFPVTWYATLRIAVDAAVIGRYPDTARTFMPDGLPAVPATGRDLPQRLIAQPRLAETLQRIADRGPTDFYTGETGRRIVEGMRAGGGLIDADDLASYRAHVEPVLEVTYGDWRIGTLPGPTGGPTLARILGDFQPGDIEFGSADYLHRLTLTMRAAFADRYAHMGGKLEAVPTSTTLMAAADADGMVVSCTQTLLSAFGSRVTVPGTGVLLNDAMYSFDPRPGLPNSPGPSKRPLSNMATLVASGPGGWPRVGLGSSGGRRIMAANAQMVLAIVDGGLGLPDALNAPRIDASGDQVLADDRIAPSVLDELRARGHDVIAVEETPYPQHFASPAGVVASEDGLRVSAADAFMPTAAAMAR